MVAHNKERKTWVTNKIQNFLNYLKATTNYDPLINNRREIKLVMKQKIKRKKNNKTFRYFIPAVKSFSNY